MVRRDAVPHDLWVVGCVRLEPPKILSAAYIPYLYCSHRASHRWLRAPCFHPKLISAPLLSTISTPISLAASLDRGHTKNMVEIMSSQRKRNQLSALFTSMVYPVTPKGLREVSFRSLRDNPGWSINKLEPVSTIRRRQFPSISNVEGAPYSRTAIVGFRQHFRARRGGVSCLRSHLLLVSLHGCFFRTYPCSHFLRLLSWLAWTF